jgi:DNA helicase-2/ATP-dependent DNA helicase PcrA
MIDLLASHHGNITVVGDDAQSIYSFRGASISNILGFPDRYPDTQIFNLEVNYRSTPPVLRAANSSISRNENQFAKRLRAVREGDILPAVVGVRDVYRQAEFVGDRIGQVLEDGVQPGEIAILYRAHYHSMEIQTELAGRGIPFEVRGGPKFFEQEHVKDVVSFLRILGNPMDEMSWKRVLLLCPGVGRKTADRVWEKLSASPDPLAAVMSGGLKGAAKGKAAAGMLSLEGLFGDLAAERDGDGGNLVTCVVEGLYDDHMRSTYPDYADRLMDIEQLGGLAGNYDDLTQFLSGLALLTDAVEPGAQGTFPEDERVVLSTIHQAKGLEWKVVFLVWLVDGKMPSARSLLEPGGEEEERRLFYVALTRAKDELYLVYPTVSTSRDNYGMGNSPSRFIMELDQDTYEHHGTSVWQNMEWEW